MYKWIDGQWCEVADYIPRQLSYGNKQACVYLAIEETYQQEGKGTSPLVKVGLTRGMGFRRGSLFSVYGVRTVREIPTSDKHLEHIEADLINWLHNAPTAQRRSTETAYIDGSVVDLMVQAFESLVKTLEHYYESAD